MTTTTMRRWGSTVLIGLLSVIGAVTFVPLGKAQAHSHEDEMRMPIVTRTPSAIEFRQDMREAWADHVSWTRNVILSFAHDLPDKAAVVDRLLKNQADIGALFQPYYGQRAADQLTGLLREHIFIAADILTAAKAGDSVAVGAAVARWQANADAISLFLSRLNRRWDFEEIKAMMHEHLDLTLTEAVARLEGRYVDDVAAYDAVFDAVMEMADMFSVGIILQQPRRFFD